VKILIISPGKAHDYTVADGIREYEKRLEKRFSLSWVHPTPGTKESEGAAILKQIKDTDTVVLLDERGRDIDTQGGAKLLEKIMLSGTKRLVFVIGGAFGVDEAVAARANHTVKLSSLVFPHMLVRLILVEQLYRALSILDGGKYHHA
jgi:23S rRNA (pseudouridine1915-N3)-methyltransferase